MLIIGIQLSEVKTNLAFGKYSMDFRLPTTIHFFFVGLEIPDQTIRNLLENCFWWIKTQTGASLQICARVGTQLLEYAVGASMAIGNGIWILVLENATCDVFSFFSFERST